jgi:hypothetical protein
MGRLQKAITKKQKKWGKYPGNAKKNYPCILYPD